ncbi:hypothetical protein [Streptomyces sp. ML-6]|uniref:hypothetical protein n=1 Tax=Streptomyces sp. ML-6 TaxID=2982693 RepID=UPI0024C0DA6F|nr:hypothetical protein [Streptomyces sp. ML-6]MDK0524865.1 hypothetical protein [Streptomyces sp. ML-6]
MPTAAVLQQRPSLCSKTSMPLRRALEQASKETLAQFAAAASRTTPPQGGLFTTRFRTPKSQANA